MTTQTVTPTIEDSIRTALDAADTAITVTREFDQVRTDYAKTRAEVKAINRQMMIVFLSSLAASVIAVGTAGLIYFRTMSEMQTANATSLEALVVFAENVDRLAAATSAADATAQKLVGVVDGVEALKGMMGDATAKLDAQAEASAASMTDLQTAVTGVVGQMSTATIDKLSADIAALQTGLAAQIEKLGGGAEGAEGAASPLAEISAKLETMMLLQKEISAKITVANNPPRPPARTSSPPAPAPRPAPRADDMITFP